MNVLLERYLDEARANLSHLPDCKRDLELMELRSHLEADVVTRIALGKSEEEATQEALAQFGDIRQVCNGLRQADRRSKQSWLDTPFHAVALTMLFHYASYVLSGYVLICWNSVRAEAQAISGSEWQTGAAVLMLLVAGLRMVSGWLIGWIAPRHGVVGAGVGYVLMTWLINAYTEYRLAATNADIHVYTNLTVLVINFLIFGMGFLGFAWLGSRQAHPLRAVSR